jgi:hypothetical protein
VKKVGATSGKVVNLINSADDEEPDLEEQAANVNASDDEVVENKDEDNNSIKVGDPQPDISQEDQDQKEGE